MDVAPSTTALSRTATRHPPDAGEPGTLGLPAQRPADRDRPQAEQQPGRDPPVRAGQRAPDRADPRPGHVALRGRGRPPARRRDARVPRPPPEDPPVLPPPLRAGPPPPADRPAPEREPPDADRRVLHPGIRAGVGGAVQSVDGLAPRPVGPGPRARGGSCSACGPPARGTSRRSRSAAATVDAENRIRMDEPTRFVTAPELVPNTLYDKNLFSRKLVELGIDGPFAEPGPGDARRPVHDSRSWSGPSDRPLHQSRPRHRELEPVAQGMLTLRQGQLRDLLQPRAATSRSGSSSPRRPPRPTASRTPASSSSTTTTARSAITPPTPPSTAR